MELFFTVAAIAIILVVIVPAALVFGGAILTALVAVILWVAEKVARTRLWWFITRKEERVIKTHLAQHFRRHPRMDNERREQYEQRYRAMRSTGSWRPWEGR